MTDTQAEKAVGAKAKASPRTGLKVERVHTKPGVHPYDEVDWARRDIVMVNWRDGSENFRQDGVEFPTSWSYNAANIVVTKYFRGNVGMPGRESSLKHVIDRVVTRYTDEGDSNGYFLTEEDREAFRAELTYLLLHQHFAFNSPVWFNVGAKGRDEQVSACQPYHALVNTPNGPVPIGQLVEENRIGEKVYYEGGYTEVIGVKNNGIKEVLRVVSKSGHMLDVTADHLVWRVGHGGTGGAWVPAGDLKPGDNLMYARTTADGSEWDASPHDIASAALAGWLQSDGCVTTSERHYSSPMVEAMTANEDEHAYVLDLFDTVFPGAHYKVSDVPYSKGVRRVRMYGKQLLPFIDKYGLLARGVEMDAPDFLRTAPLPVVSAYLKAVFQAEGYVTNDKDTSCLIGLQMISYKMVESLQVLLARFGIFSRLRLGEQVDGTAPERFAVDRDDYMRYPAAFVGIGTLGDQQLFAEHIGFVASNKRERLAARLDRNGVPAKSHKTLQIAEIIPMGEQTVYDIQTTAGEYLSNNIAVHNCFILSVDDSMESILNWYREEGLIFKGGSGAGLNLSRIRGSKELLKSGGTASGPVSFMRGADASAGAIKSGGGTRRAAKMVVLDVDHPDIETFIDLKVKEEGKIRALKAAGYDMDLGGEDMTSVQYQNANNSVRVTDAFMKAVESDSDFHLLARTDGAVVDTVKARSVWDRLNQAAWSCADPGIQYDSTINDWHTNPETGRITGSNPCSEYMSLDNSSCNLASLNLLKYLKADDTFDIETFALDAALIFTAMDISICFGSFPTEAITKTTHDYRQLGIGYANLGALLMATGHGYNSSGGRALAGAITSLLTGVAYRRSAEIAETLGAYNGFAPNRDAHLRVMRKHTEAASSLRDTLKGEGHRFIREGLVERDADGDALAIAEAALLQWRQGYEVGQQHGYRNAQASLLAPTGTIGFMMDCDTTGGEPEFSLVKHKKLVGGGDMQIVNLTIPRALKKLGYDPDVIKGIEEYILQHGHVVDAPGLDPAHYEVFDCAVGMRAIPPMGHILMMAAQQPFLSGAISKTVNLPSEATVEDIAHVHMEGWRLGLKAIAVYRDNSKVGQPLSVKGASPEVVEEANGRIAELEAEVTRLKAAKSTPVRRKLPKQRPSLTTHFDVAGAGGYMTTGMYEHEDGTPGGDDLGEVFIKMSKQGSTLAGVMDAFSIAVSIGLQYGVPLETFVAKFTGMRFDPAGMTDDPDLRMTSSVMDYLFRRLAIDHLDTDIRHQLGVYTSKERERYNETGTYALPEDEHDPEVLATSVGVDTPSLPDKPTRADVLDVITSREVVLPLCDKCGNQMRPSGSCYACEGCGTTSGCS